MIVEVGTGKRVIDSIATSQNTGAGILGLEAVLEMVDKDVECYATWGHNAVVFRTTDSLDGEVLGVLRKECDMYIVEVPAVEVPWTDGIIRGKTSSVKLAAEMLFALDLGRS